MITAKFKDSPLGPIPQDWEVKRLGEICDVQLGKMLDSAKNQGEECFYLTNKDVQWGRISVSDLRRMRMSEDDRQRFSLRQGDLLVCEGGEVGRCAIWNSEVEGCCFQKTIHRVRAKVSDTIDMRFLQPLLCVYAKKGAFDPYISCTSIAHLTKEKFELLEIICPPFPVQQRIAEALGEVDKLIESLYEQIEKKRLIAKGVAHDLLSGTKRLPGFKREWREVAFKVAFIALGNNTYARECLCGDSANAYDIHYGDVLIRFGAVVDFSSDYIPRLKDGIKPNKDFLQDGDIVFADTAEDEMVGKAVEIHGLGDDKAVSGLHTMACRPRADMFAPRFLGYYLNSDSYRKQLLPLITGSKVSSLSRANFESTTLTMPDVSEQQAIADLLSEQDAAIDALEAKREKYVRIKEGMMRDLLTGKVRMKGE